MSETMTSGANVGRKRRVGADAIRAFADLRNGDPPWTVDEICAAFRISRATYFRRMAEAREWAEAEMRRRADADA